MAKQDDGAPVVTVGTWFDLLVPIVNRKIYGGSMTWSMAATTLLWWPWGRGLAPLVPTINTKTSGRSVMWPVVITPVLRWPRARGLAL